MSNVWPLTSGVKCVGVHAVLAEGAEYDDVLKCVHECRTVKFKMTYVRAQTERDGLACHETHL
ncbi:MAG TPA: hypothetical protein PLL77_15595 [Pyrinomonadaceae bacterium]|nr:hypothetical protein [Pyrinomonadaceae bacterium]